MKKTISDASSPSSFALPSLLVCLHVFGLALVFEGVFCKAATAEAYVEGLPTEEDRHEQQRMLICGPRCVQFVLDYYGHEEGVIEIVREIQWPHLSRGCSLADIEDALRKRGIHTQAIRLESRATLDWPHPVILHLSAGRNEMGHFVVWLPCSTGGAADIWDGGLRIRQVAQRSLSEQRTGFALLTSPKPIDNADCAVESSDSAAKIVVWLAVLCAGIPLLWALARSRMQVNSFRELFQEKGDVPC